MNTLDYIFHKYQLNPNANRMPIEIPNVGRDDLAGLFAELGFTTGAEIGVQTGLYSEVLCQGNPNLHLYCVDAWEPYSRYREHTTKKTMDAFLEEAQARLGPYQCTLIKKFSMDAVKDFSPESLDFVYIDANHEFRHVVDDIHEWSGKVRSGGIVSGHDYLGRASPVYNVHVIEAVNGYTRAYGIRPWFVLGTKEIKPDEKRDQPRSWMWVKRET